MKQEYLIAFGGVWYRIYVHQHDLWVDRKENGRFHAEKCLLSQVEDSFSATATETYLHCVCKCADGVFYLLFDGTNWHTKKLMEKKDADNTSCHTLLANGKFVHLLFSCKNNEQNLLVHQLLGYGGSHPTSVDEIGENNFCVSGEDNGDFTLLYANKEGDLGIRRFRWSEKKFEAFFPLQCGCKLRNAVLYAKDNLLHIAAYAVFDSFINLLFLSKDITSDDTTLSAVHLLSGEAGPICLDNSSTHPAISWCESGTILRAQTTEKGHWSLPQKYVRATGRENVYCRVIGDTKCYDTFGYFKNGRMMLYTGEDLPETNITSVDKTPKAFPSKKTAVSTTKESAEPEEIYIRRSIYTADMAALRRLIEHQNHLIIELHKKILKMEDKNTSLGSI